MEELIVDRLYFLDSGLFIQKSSCIPNKRISRVSTFVLVVLGDENVESVRLLRWLIDGLHTFVPPHQQPNVTTLASEYEWRLQGCQYYMHG